MTSAFARAALLGLVIALPACATLEKDYQARLAQQAQAEAASKQTLETNLQNWMGHQASQLVTEWGLPTQLMSMPDGTSVYVYDWAGTDQLANNDPHAANRMTMARDQGATWCEERFTAERDGKLSRWSWQANGGGCYR